MMILLFNSTRSVCTTLARICRRKTLLGGVFCWLELSLEREDQVFEVWTEVKNGIERKGGGNKKRYRPTGVTVGDEKDEEWICVAQST